MSDLKKSINENLKSDGKITCSDAFKIAEELGLTPAEVGNEIENMKIKIKGCQLGCFK